MSRAMRRNVNNCFQVLFALLTQSVLAVRLCQAHNETVPSEVDTQALVALLEKSYGEMTQPSRTVIEIHWVVSFRDDFSALPIRRETSQFGHATDEIERENGVSWIRYDGDWRRESQPAGKTRGPVSLITSVSICSADFVVDSRSLRAPLVTLQYQTDDRIGKRGLSANSVMNTGLVARVLREEIRRGVRFTVESRHSDISIRSVDPGDLDVVIDARTGTIQSLSTRMAEDVYLDATYSGSLAGSTYPAPQPAEMLLQLRNRANSGAITCSRFRFLRAAIAEEQPGRFDWSEISPLAHWQGSESVFGKDGSVDAGASARLASHSAEVAKPTREDFEYSMNQPPRLIDHSINWRTWILSLGISLLATAGLIAWRRR